MVEATATLPSRGANRYAELTAFANTLIRIDEETGFKVSSRGWDGSVTDASTKNRTMHREGGDLMCLIRRAEATGLLARAVDIAVGSMEAPTQQIRQGKREIWKAVSKLR